MGAEGAVARIVGRNATIGALGSLAYCATLGGAFDHYHWLWSAVDNVTIIDHFVRWL